MADEPSKDECKICDLVLIAVGSIVAGILAFMVIDLATKGKLSGAISGGPLATVTQLRDDDDTGTSDAG